MGSAAQLASRWQSEFCVHKSWRALNNQDTFRIGSLVLCIEFCFLGHQRKKKEEKIN
jgi:hypothetical protein